MRFCTDCISKFITEELGFDGGFNYKKEDPVKALTRLIGEPPEHGIDVYYDNVGGEQLDAAMGAMSMSLRSKKPWYKD